MIPKNCHPERSEGSAVPTYARKLAILTVGLSIVGGSSSQTAAAPAEWHTFDRLCGRLYGKAIPERKNPHVMKPRKALSKVPLLLYQWQEGMPCCSGLTLVDSVTTRRNGGFEFKKATPGKYFIVANWSGSAPSLEITVTDKLKSPTACSEQGLQIEDQDRLGKWMTVRVD